MYYLWGLFIGWEKMKLLDFESIKGVLILYIGQVLKLQKMFIFKLLVTIHHEWGCRSIRYAFLSAA